MSRILLVEDMPQVARLMETMLRARHEVQFAGSGEEAIAALEKTPFDAVVCDLGLPDMRGTALHAWCAAHQPELARRFVLVSGYALEVELAGKARTPATRLQKPFTAQELLDAVDAALASGAVAS